MMKKAVLVLVVICGIAAIVFADDKDKKKDKDRERIYSASYDRVWDAAIKSANEQFVVEHSDKSSGIFAFDTGKATKAKRFRIGVTVTKISEHETKVNLRLQVIGGPLLWGSKKDQTVDKFWNALDAKLKEQPLPSKQKGEQAESSSNSLARCESNNYWHALRLRSWSIATRRPA